MTYKVIIKDLTGDTEVYEADSLDFSLPQTLVIIYDNLTPLSHYAKINLNNVIKVEVINLDD